MQLPDLADGIERPRKRPLTAGDGPGIADRRVRPSRPRAIGIPPLGAASRKVVEVGRALQLRIDPHRRPARLVVDDGLAVVQRIGLAGLPAGLVVREAEPIVAGVLNRDHLTRRVVDRRRAIPQRIDLREAWLVASYTVVTPRNMPGWTWPGKLSRGRSS